MAVGWKMTLFAMEVAMVILVAQELIAVVETTLTALCFRLCLKKNVVDALLCNVPTHRSELLKCFTNIGTKCLTLAILTTLGFIAGILTQGLSYTFNQKEFLFLSLLVCLLWLRFCWHLC